MKDLLDTYYSLNTSLKKDYELIERKWLKILKDNNLSYIAANIYETGRDPHDLTLMFYLQSTEELPVETIHRIESEASCQFYKVDKEITLIDVHINGSERYFYTFKPLKITHNPIEDSWLKD